MYTSLVTGGAGFIGSHIVDLLIEKGHKVIIIDNLSTGNKKNINPKAKFYQTDITSPEIAAIFTKEKPDFVFHLAAQIDVRVSVSDPILDAQTNILGALNIIENSSKSNVNKIIFASTGGAIYGEADIIPTPEGYPEKPLSPYGIAKLSIEKYLYYYRTIKNLDYASLRMANIYGPRQNSKSEAGVIAIFIDKLLQGEQPIINGDGTIARDYVYVKDAAKAYILALEKPVSGEFNIGTAKETTVNEIYQKIIEKIQIDALPIHGPAKVGEQKRSCLSWKKANKELGWSPEYDLDKGIAETVKWFRAQK